LLEKGKQTLPEVKIEILERGQRGQRRGSWGVPKFQAKNARASKRRGKNATQRHLWSAATP
jgi:hypothetical protein